MSNATLNTAHMEKLFDPRLACAIELVGVGGVGSQIAMKLAKTGFTDIRVWDDDFVASHNVPMSGYGNCHIAMPKVLALQEEIERYTGVTIDARYQKYQGEAFRRQSVVISSVDDMDARLNIWNQIQGKLSIPFFCETRMEGAFIDVLALRPYQKEDVERYKALWFPNSEARAHVCGTHGIIYATSHAADVVVANITQFLSGEPYRWRNADRCDTLTRVL